MNYKECIKLDYCLGLATEIISRALWTTIKEYFLRPTGDSASHQLKEFLISSLAKSMDLWTSIVFIKGLQHLNNMHCCPWNVFITRFYTENLHQAIHRYGVPVEIYCTRKIQCTFNHRHGNMTCIQGTVKMFSCICVTYIFRPFQVVTRDHTSLQNNKIWLKLHFQDVSIW